MFSVDGMAWDIPCSITRVSEVTPSDISGQLLDRTYFNDVLGTYLHYDVSLAVPRGMGRKYASIYEVLTEPKGWHEFVMPYNDRTITFTGRIEDVSDVYVRLPNGKDLWKGVTFTVTASAPTKVQTLDEAISYGGAPLIPDYESAAIGDVYEYTENGWVEAAYDDADVKRY